MKRIVILSVFAIIGTIIMCSIILGLIISGNFDYREMIMTLMGIGFVIFVTGFVNLVIELFRKDKN